MKGEIKDGWIKWRKFTKQSEKSIFLMNDLTLLDLECILVDNNRGKFNIERNGEKMFDVDSDELWEEMHKEKIIKAEFFGEEDIIYIKLESNELMLLL